MIFIPCLSYLIWASHFLSSWLLHQSANFSILLFLVKTPELLYKPYVVCTSPQHTTSESASEVAACSGYSMSPTWHLTIHWSSFRISHPIDLPFKEHFWPQLSLTPEGLKQDLPVTTLFKRQFQDKSARWRNGKQRQEIVQSKSSTGSRVSDPVTNQDTTPMQPL